jgi:hypothetical protein
MPTLACSNPLRARASIRGKVQWGALVAVLMMVVAVVGLWASSLVYQQQKFNDIQRDVSETQKSFAEQITTQNEQLNRYRLDSLKQEDRLKDLEKGFNEGLAKSQESMNNQGKDLADLKDSNEVLVEKSNQYDSQMAQLNEMLDKTQKILEAQSGELKKVTDGIKNRDDKFETRISALEEKFVIAETFIKGQVNRVSGTPMGSTPMPGAPGAVSTTTTITTTSPGASAPIPSTPVAPRPTQTSLKDF